MYILCLSRGLDAINQWLADYAGPPPTVAFMPNAGDTYADPYFVEESRRRLELLGFATHIVDLRRINSGDEFAHALSTCQAVFASGGNSFNLVYELQRSGSLGALRDAVQNGLPYFGESAGAAILYESVEPFAMIDDPQDVPQLTSMEALGLVDFMTLPHVNREKYRDLFDRFYQAQSPSHRIIKIRDDQAILTHDGSSLEILDSPISPLD
jgi:dipeptidase E